MHNASDSMPTEEISPIGAGISLVALLTFDIAGSIVLIFSLYLHLRKVKERQLNTRTAFQLLLYFTMIEFAYSTFVESISVVCYLNESFDLTMSRALCLFQAWAGLTFTGSATWTMTLLAVERFLSGTKPVSSQGQKRRRDRLLYTCYTGITISAILAVVPVTREDSVTIFDPSRGFCHFSYSVNDDPLMTSFCICIIVLTLILFQIQFYSFVNLLCEERQTVKAVKHKIKLDYEEQNTSKHQNLAIYQEYWLYRSKHRRTFGGRHEWNLTATVLSLVAWLWLCLLLFLVSLVKSQSGGEVSPQISFAAVRMLSIHNAINPFLTIFIFAPFRQRALHFITCGRIEYSRDDFILSKYLEHDVTSNSEPNWWRVVERNQWDETIPTERHRNGTYVYENDVTDDVDSYYESEYESNRSYSHDDGRSGRSTQSTVPSSVYYLNDEGAADVSNDYLLSVPVNRPGAGSGEIVERIFILHESAKIGSDGNGFIKSSSELIGEDVSNSPKLRKVVQSDRFQEMLKRNRRDREDISPRLFKVVPPDSSLLQSEYAMRDLDSKVINEGKQSSTFIESVQMTPKLRRIVESPAFRTAALQSDSFVIDSESSSSSPEHLRRSGPHESSRTEHGNVTSTPKLKRIVQSQNFKQFVMKQQQNTESLKLTKVSRTPHLITVVDSRSKQNGAVARAKSKWSALSHNDVELLELSDESTQSVDRQINTPGKRRNIATKSQEKSLEGLKRKNVRAKYINSFPQETALLQDVGAKPLQILGLSPKYNKNKPEENGLFSKGDDRPEILNALFQKALLVGSSTKIVDVDELNETAGSSSGRLANGSIKKSLDSSHDQSTGRNKSDSWGNGLDGKEILIDAKFSATSTGRDNKEYVKNSTKSGKVTFQLDDDTLKQKEDKLDRDRVAMETAEKLGKSSATDKGKLSLKNDDECLDVNEAVETEKFVMGQNDYKEQTVDKLADLMSQDRDVKGDDWVTFSHENSETSTLKDEAVHSQSDKFKEEVSLLNKAFLDQKTELQVKVEEDDTETSCDREGVDVGLEGEAVETLDDNSNRTSMNNSGSRVPEVPKIVISEEGSNGIGQANANRQGLTHESDNRCDKTMHDDVTNLEDPEGERIKEDLTGNGECGEVMLPVITLNDFGSSELGAGNSSMANGQKKGMFGQNYNLPNVGYKVNSNDNECLENSPIRHQVDVFVESVIQNILKENGETDNKNKDGILS